MGPVSDLATIAAELAPERRGDRRVVLANGCFDLLHVGHLRYLEAAARLGDLVVGLNSDRSVRALKGPGQPLQEETDRSRLIAALRCVDFVFLFDEPTVENALRTLRPDFHCKGTDYTAKNVPERTIAAEIGARVAITGDPKNHATRDLIATILKTPS